MNYQFQIRMLNFLKIPCPSNNLITSNTCLLFMRFLPISFSWLRYLIFPSLLIFTMSGTFSQTVSSDSLKKDKQKTGFNFGALPAIAFDSNLGFKYGVLANFYDYGDGSKYPMYKHSLYVEWSRTTKGSGTNQVIYDSEYLLPHIRTTLEYDYFTEKALDFYGFNGYESYYDPNLEDKKSNSYISQMYYRLERKLNHLKIDFQGNISGRNLRWLAGIEYFGNKLATVNISALNKGKKEEDQLPDTMLLYDKFVNWGIISQDQKNGGDNTFLKFGLVYDTRDNEPNPMKGLWTEALVLAGIPRIGTSKYTFSKLVITHRQYFTLRKEVLNLACRLSYQAKITGNMPFYMLPFVYSSMMTRDGLGGARTLRGILRNRIAGEDIFFGNLELRWKFFRKLLLNQNFYVALVGFYDFGIVTDKYSFTHSSEAISYLSQGKNESLHTSFGSGLYFAMNQNFVVNFSYGMASNDQDGRNGIYIGLNYLF
jgi:outer membrane protein assembly factor BamA